MKIIDGIPFECVRCGECCKWDGEVILTPTDIKRLSECLGMIEKDFLRAYTRKEQGFLVLINKDNKKECIFLKGNKCRVWKYKPEQCDKHPMRYDNRCPGFQLKGWGMSKKAILSELNNDLYQSLYNECSKIGTGSNSSFYSFNEESSIDSFFNDEVKDVIKVSSIRELTAFERVGNKHLIHKCTKDLWVIDSDKDGNILIRRLFKNNGEPIKG